MESYTQIDISGTQSIPNPMQQNPSWAVNPLSADQEIPPPPPHSMQLDSSWSDLQVPVICPHPEPDQSSPPIQLPQEPS
jgi:hypothetical protein